MAISAAQNVKVDASGLLGHLKDYSNMLGKSMSEVIKEQSGKFCEDMIRYTRPFGKSKKSNSGALPEMKKKVAGELYHIFKPLESARLDEIVSIGNFDLYKKWVRKLRDKGLRAGPNDPKITLFQRWTYDLDHVKPLGGYRSAFVPSGDASQLEQIHKKSRIDGGRGPMTNFAVKSKQAFAIVENKSTLKSYVKKKQDQIGVLKSPYWFAAQKIRQSIDAPAWAKHSEGLKNAIAIENLTDKAKPEITVGNLIGNKLGNSANVRAAINHRAYAMRRQMAEHMKSKGSAIWLEAAKGNLTATIQHFK
ncbi:hypothetical protein UFOVP201_27 [uncultured Caudovirales phage]|uniref:Uncharacterized protein n=1 Tax=uncultured Caudovirales phage TaxID=2100421 RepID=A0A6J7WM55_9CAUD|nr:hypothetical protein UFOVP201_27 [uncultured Caudovirales phage]